MENGAKRPRNFDEVLGYGQKPGFELPKLYPNPSSTGEMNISSDIEIDLIKIYDMKGGLIREFEINNVRKIQLMLSNLDHGSYLLVIYDKYGEYSAHRIEL